MAHIGKDKKNLLGKCLCARNPLKMANNNNNLLIQNNVYVAKCNLGKVKLERVGQWSSPIAVRDMRGGHLGIRRALLGLCS